MSVPLLDTFWIDSRSHSTVGTLAQSSVSLAAGRRYRCVIDGNWTAWDRTLTYGETTVPIKYSSGGAISYAAFDYEVQFASVDPGTYPSHGGEVLFSTDGGGTLTHVEVVGGPTTVRDSDAEYTFFVVGEGGALRGGVADNLISDNNGQMRVRIYPAGRPVVGLVAWR